MREALKDLGGCVIVGKKPLSQLVGFDTVKQALAMTKFEGRRAVQRGTWENYCYLKPKGGWVVGVKDPAQATKLGLQALSAVEVGIRWGQRIRDGEEPFTAPKPKYHASEFDQEDPCEVVGIDFEGTDMPTRVSIGTKQQTVTSQMDLPTRTLLRSVVEKASTVVMHNCVFDLAMAEKVGVEIDRAKVFDTMIAHQILNPWQRRGLGHCASLYVMTAPWKGIEDEELYSLMDAAILVPMYEAQVAEIERTHQRGVLDMEMQIALHEKSHFPRVFGKEAYITRAAGAMEPTGPVNASYDWTDLCRPRSNPLVLSLKSPIRTVCRRLFGDPGDLTEMEALHVLGFGVRQIRNGSSANAVDALKPNETEKETKDRLAAFDEAHSDFVAWRNQVHAAAQRDGFVTNPFGRRAYMLFGGEAQRFVALSTLFDLLKFTAIAAGPGAYSGIVPVGFVTLTPDPLRGLGMIGENEWSEK